MVYLATGSVVRQLGSLFEGGSVAGLSDRQLLERFTAQRDAAGEAAFAALVSRHGPMVLDVCRQLLGDRHHAEDAFQAVFLVLARKARSIRDPDLLANWLYGVALRTARCTRSQLTRRRKKEEGDIMRRPGPGSTAVVEPMVQSAEQPAIDREQAEALHDEIDRLPRSFRLPVILCYFEGLTLDEAARRLRCPAGTVGSRLSRAREKLRRGLTRRGVILPAATLAAALAPRSASASLSSSLCDITTRAAMKFAAGQAAAGATSASATALAREVLRSMLIHNLKFVGMTLLFVGAVATGAGYWNHSLAMKEEPVKAPAAQPRPATEPKLAAPGRMFVAGRVLDPDGNPVKGAIVEVVARPHAPRVGASTGDERFTRLGHGTTDGDGRFRLEAPRTSSTSFPALIAIGAAPGFGLGWAELNADADQPGADIRLRPEQAVRARLVDVNGLPAAGVEVRVQSMGRATDKGTWDGISFWDSPPEGLRTWPGPIKTDDQGRLVLNGVGRGLSVNFTVRDLRFARQDRTVEPAGPTASRDTEKTIALESSRIIEGRVLAADTGKPIPNAVVSATTRVHNENANGFFTTKFRADAQGRFQMNPIAGEVYTLGAFPTGGEPYLIQQDELKWTRGAVKTTHDIKLPRGVSIRGKVTEQGTGRPLAGSSIQFIPLGGGDKVLWGWQAIVASKDDGSYQIAVPPGKGHLLVFGPTPDYVLEEIGSNRLHGEQPGGMRYHAHDIIAYEVKPGDSPHEVAATLRPGVTIKGRVEGPDGQTVTDASILTTLRIEATNPFWRGDYQIPIRDGRFELHGLAPEASPRVFILDSEHEWGASVEVSGKQAGEELTIRLQPCGRARARFVGPNGRPVAKHQPHFEFVATPGPSRYRRSEKVRAELSADAEFMANVDRKHYWTGPVADAEGRVTLPDLIPGALYRIIDFSTVNDQDKGVQIRKDFTVKPGETLDLGDIVIEKPREP
jgi:RNA polymerase sigma factor (sigma-70 family)